MSINLVRSNHVPSLFPRLVSQVARLDAGADVNAQVNDSTALYTASAYGYEEMMQILVDTGADVNA